MIAADVMSRRVVAISPDAPLVQAIRLMVDQHVSGLPVISSDGFVIGMLTEGDLLRRVETGTCGQAPGWFMSFFMPGRLASRYIETHGRQVSEVMTPRVKSVDEDAPLFDVVELMRHHRIKRLPVVRGKKVVGIVSRADLVRVVGEALGAPATMADDAVIRQKLLDGLARQPWGHGSVSVVVENGKILLDGCVFDMRERAAIGVLAENTTGAKLVENRIICIEPNSGTIIYDPAEMIEPPMPT